MKPLLEILQASEGYLAARGFASARLEAEWLITHALGLRRLDLYLQFDRPLSEAELARIRPLLRRRADGEPLQYILGSAEFYNCEVLVGPGVLIPRPETERLVDAAVECNAGSGPILDLCTGSGAILLALAGALKEPPPMLGVDSSTEALDWARRNGDKLGFLQIDWRQGDLFAPVDRHDFALITANPPYVTEPEYGKLPADVRDHEPASALVAGPDGLDIVRRIVAEGRDFLVDDGWLVMEIGASQGAAVLELLAESGWREAKILPDYAHRDRVAIARK